MAWRARSLNASGAIAATLVGTATVAAGWDWGALLLAFFATSTLLSRAGRDRKSARTGAIVAKGGDRDAIQVLANGGIFAVCALLFAVCSVLFTTLSAPHSSAAAPFGGSALPIALQAGALGALAASTADTWATEVGTLAAHAPRSILTWRPVPAGTSGGITVPGTAAALTGAAALALLAAALGWPARVATAAAIGGVAGALADSLLGATVQSRRRCPACNAATERDVHPCGTRTVPAGGWPWLDNDAVNALCGVVGATVAVAVSAGYTR